MQTVFCEFMKIYPCIDLTDKSNEQAFVDSIGNALDQWLPKEVLDRQNEPELFLQQIAHLLPLVRYTPLKERGNAFSIAMICSEDYVHGIGRFLSDAIARQFLPGKIVKLFAARTLCFYFFQDLKKEFVFIERWIVANRSEEIALIEERMPRFIEELRVTLLSVVKARHFLSFHAQPLADTSPLISEIGHLSVFEEMQQIVRRLSEEKSAGEIRNSIYRLMERRPKIFDRGIFQELPAILSLYDEPFIDARSSLYISRLICTHFYFQKKLARTREEDPLKRHLLLRIFPSKEKIGILVLMNLLRENELFKKQHLLEALSQCLTEVKEMAGSFVMDASNSSQLFFYLEIENASFSLLDLKTLRTRLPLEIKRSIQKTANPLFMLRNEEDHMRYLIALTHEVRSVKDMPQVVIFFEEQSDESLIFSIILVRILKKKSTSLKDLLANFPLKTYLREQRTMGFVGRYPREASVFQASLPKQKYLRKDHSVDLPKARQKLLFHLSNHFEQVRDYNGGFLSKQLESLDQLKNLLGPLSDAHLFVLENFFFSIEPLSSQVTLPDTHLKEGFLLLLHLLDTNTHHQFGVTTAGAVASGTKERQRLRTFLQIVRESCPEISYSQAHYHDLFGCVLFLSPKHREVKGLFYSFLESQSKT